MQLLYKEDYWNEPELKKEFNRFLKQIHNLDLTLWGELGYWDNNYRPFSLFDKNRMVANACVYSLDMIIQGRKCKVAQVSGVGTDGDYRRQGLSFELNQKAINWARDNHDFFFLFADDEAVPLYKKCEFTQITEHLPRITISGTTAKAGLKKLSVDSVEDRQLIFQIASKRTAVSDLIGVLNPKLFMFWCLYFIKDYIYYIADLDIMVLFKREDQHITVFDIVGKRVPNFSEIYPYISHENDQSVEFQFMADKLGLSEFEWVKSPDDETFVMGNFPLSETKFIFPLTAHA